MLQLSDLDLATNDGVLVRTFLREADIRIVIPHRHWIVRNALLDANARTRVQGEGLGALF